MLIAGFNFFIGMFNFIPLLPLDGGHIAGALWEAMRRGFARLRGRPDPGYVDVAKLLPIAYVVASAILVMGVVLIVGRPRRPAPPRVLTAVPLVEEVALATVSKPGERRQGGDLRRPSLSRPGCRGWVVERSLGYVVARRWWFQRPLRLLSQSRSPRSTVVVAVERFLEIVVHIPVKQGVFGLGVSVVGA